MVTVDTTTTLNGSVSLILLGILGVVVLLVLLGLLRVLSIQRKLRHASRAGRAASAAISASDTPLTTFNRAGKAGDPINMQITGTSGQVGAAFAAAGWYRADEIDFVTSLRISVDSVFGRGYTTAPVSNLYLYGRKEDLAFERPGRNVRQRDHIRFWTTGRNAVDGRPIWIGSGTKDVKVELSKTNHLPTHGISPDLDAERDLVVSELAQTGWVTADTTRPGLGKETHGFNGGGDPYFTDGQVAVLTLANVWTLPLADNVRSPLGGRITRGLARLVRGRLPKGGLERAEREARRLRERDLQARSALPSGGGRADGSA
ncbi:MAG TPA: LssY C-terminal domain-containing protein [Ktedonobacterales bacterium]|nr:LssY C-terminal domain-containing protein [Ktedonobacterales bacterium]